MDGREFSSTLYCPTNLVDSGDQEGGEWRLIGTESHFRNLGRVGAYRGGRVPEGMRNYLRDYFVSKVGESEAPWQYEKTLL